MIRQLKMSSLRALEREAILAAQVSCYVTLARWISAPVTFINCATSLGVPAVVGPARRLSLTTPLSCLFEDNANKCVLAAHVADVVVAKAPRKVLL